MKCPGCQHENQVGAKFCQECGAPLARVCPNCQSQVPAAAKFCPECAHPLTARAGEPLFTPPKSYTPQHLVEKILSSKSVLEGAMRPTSILRRQGANCRRPAHVADLERDGRDASAARDALEVLESTLQLMSNHRAMITRMIETHERRNDG